MSIKKEPVNPGSFLCNQLYTDSGFSRPLLQKVDKLMYTTTEIMREMLEIGMIRKEEYAEMASDYRDIIRTIQKMKCNNCFQ